MATQLLPTDGDNAPVSPSLSNDGPTDGRKPGEWTSRYPEKLAKKGIWCEAAYLVIQLHMGPIALALLWTGSLQSFLHLNPGQSYILFKYGSAWVAGTLGGTLFALKWLYHAVARNYWHEDRRPWRLFTPVISGGLAFGVMTLISSGLLTIFDEKIFNRGSAVVGLSFMVGYFSDSAIAKLSELAETLFGPKRNQSVSSIKEKSQPEKLL